jgi:chemotaxis protein MotD
MTRVDVASVPGSVPADKSGKGGRGTDASSGFDEADAGFSAQLATVAAEEDGSGDGAPSAKGIGGTVIARWWRQQVGGEATPQAPAVNQGDQKGVAAAGAMMLGKKAQTAALLPAVDADAAADADPTVAEDETGTQAEASGPGMAPAGDGLPTPDAAPIATATIPNMPAAVAMVAPPTTTPQVTDGNGQSVPTKLPLPPASDTGAEEKVAVVKVVRTETHFAPVQPFAPPAAKGPTPVQSGATVVGRAGSPDSKKSDQSTGEAKQASAPASRVQSREQMLGPTAPSDSDPDTAQPNANGENALLAVPLSTRAPGQGTQSFASPTQQIADCIANELSGATDASRSSGTGTIARPMGLEPVKVLTIHLQPADLGTVTVRMALKADVMEVQVEAGRRTARLIDADRETLAGLLRSAGYHVEALTVRAVEQPSAPASVAGGPPAGAQDSGAQLQSGGSQPDARASGGRGQPETRSPIHVPDKESNDSEQAIGGRRGAGLYV